MRSLAGVVGAAAADDMPGVTDVEQAERLLVDRILCQTGNRAGEGRLLDASEPSRGVEHTIALLKRWRGLSDGYRGPLARFPVTLRTMVALEKFRICETPF